MIASNYRRFPDAMALQLVLIFGRCTWHTARPTTRLGRAQRAERSRLVKETPQVVRWVAKTVPVWWRLAKKAARALAKDVQAALLSLVWDQVTDVDLSEPVDVLEALFDQAYEAHSWKWQPDPFRRLIALKGREQIWEHYGTGDACEAVQRALGYRG